MFESIRISKTSVLLMFWIVAANAGNKKTINTYRLYIFYKNLGVIKLL